MHSQVYSSPVLEIDVEEEVRHQPGNVEISMVHKICSSLGKIIVNDNSQQAWQVEHVIYVLFFIPTFHKITVRKPALHKTTPTVGHSEISCRLAADERVYLYKEKNLSSNFNNILHEVNV